MDCSKEKMAENYDFLTHFGTWIPSIRSHALVKTHFFHDVQDQTAALDACIKKNHTIDAEEELKLTPLDGMWVIQLYSYVHLYNVIQVKSGKYNIYIYIYTYDIAYKLRL